MRNKCKSLNFTICLAGMEDHHEQAWMIGKGGPPMAPYQTIYGSHAWSGGQSMARKIAIDGPGEPSVA